MRAHNNAWVMVRQGPEGELYSVMERASETLLLASDSVERMSRR